MSVLATLTSQAEAAGLAHLVIGGNAVIAYGYPRHTADFDFLVRNRDRYRWDRLVKALDYYQKHVHSVFHMYKSDGQNCPPIDFMFVDDQTFEKFEAGAKQSTIAGISVRIPALIHLLALKLHAERSGGDTRGGRDLNDVLHLMQINQIKLADEDFEEIMTRFGNEAIKRRLSLLLEGYPLSGF